MWKRLNNILSDPNRPFVHRDFSWISFNERVLSEAMVSDNPVLERLKFLGITSSNLDEFFMIRISSLDRELLSLSRSKDSQQEKIGRLDQIQNEINYSIRKFHKKQTTIFNQLKKELGIHNIFIIRSRPTEEWIKKALEQVFLNECAPHLSQPKDFHPNEIAKMKNLQLGILFSNGKFLEVPKNIPKTFWIQGGQGKFALIFLDDLLKIQSPITFGIRAKAIGLRLIRDADISVDLEDAESSSIPDQVRTKMRYRDKSNPVALYMSSPIDDERIQQIKSSLKLDGSRLFQVKHPLMLQGAFQFANELSKNIRFQKDSLVYSKFEPRLPKSFEKPSGIFKRILERDYFLHHPYDSFEAYINFIEEACKDPFVTHIQQTIYRVDQLSKVVSLLKKVAHKKKIKVFIEPRARFDEVNNIELAEDLRAAGVEVYFAQGNLKLHAKISLVIKKEKAVTTLFTHLSTGNYNAKTARLYTDMSIFTARKEVGRDAQLFFSSVEQRKIPEDFKTLVLAPTKLHRRLLSLIQTETQAAKRGQPARIFAKLNTLVDENVVNSLYEASKAGVKIDLNVRGACSLIPKIQGLSENIRVFSIIDRFLEHSRIYYFESSGVIYLSSADWMPRNFFKRLELAFPILDSQIALYIREYVIPVYLKGRAKSWELNKKGQWRRRRKLKNSENPKAQKVFQKLAASSYKDTPLNTKFVKTQKA